MIAVTKTYLPALEEYQHHLRGIWERCWITNHGTLVQELEGRLREHLGVPHLHYVSNGTVALQIALKMLGITGEVITTPFSYVATTGSILWQGCRPVFVDIEVRTFCLDPARIEAAITSQTQAILATHVYGYPCDVEAISVFARKHRLKVIYDGAHAFGSRFRGRSLLSFGDITTASFHATKLFHTVEGGAVITADPELSEQILLVRSFGHRGDDHFTIGINAKNSEFHAAMGLCVLPRVAQFIAARRIICEQYDRYLLNSELERPQPPAELDYNYAYYPVVFPSEDQLEKVKSALERHQIFPRRYFWPALNRLPYCQGASCPVAEGIASRVLCLPLYPGLEDTAIKQIASLVIDNL